MSTNDNGDMLVGCEHHIETNSVSSSVTSQSQEPMYRAGGGPTRQTGAFPPLEINSHCVWRQPEHVFQETTLRNHAEPNYIFSATGMAVVNIAETHLKPHPEHLCDFALGNQPDLGNAEGQLRASVAKGTARTLAVLANGHLALDELENSREEGEDAVDEESGEGQNKKKKKGSSSTGKRPGSSIRIPHPQNPTIQVARRYLAFESLLERNDGKEETYDAETGQLYVDGVPIEYDTNNYKHIGTRVWFLTYDTNYCENAAVGHWIRSHQKQAKWITKSHLDPSFRADPFSAGGKRKAPGSEASELAKFWQLRLECTTPAEWRDAQLGYVSAGGANVSDQTERFFASEKDGTRRSTTGDSNNVGFTGRYEDWKLGPKHLLDPLSNKACFCAGLEKMDLATGTYVGVNLVSWQRDIGNYFPWKKHSYVEREVERSHYQGEKYDFIVPTPVNALKLMNIHNHTLDDTTTALTVRLPMPTCSSATMPSELLDCMRLVKGYGLGTFKKDPEYLRKDLVPDCVVEEYNKRVFAADGNATGTLCETTLLDLQSLNQRSGCGWWGTSKSLSKGATYPIRKTRSYIGRAIKLHELAKRHKLQAEEVNYNNEVGALIRPLVEERMAPDVEKLDAELDQLDAQIEEAPDSSVEPLVLKQQCLVTQYPVKRDELAKKYAAEIRHEKRADPDIVALFEEYNDGVTAIENESTKVGYAIDRWAIMHLSMLICNRPDELPPGWIRRWRNAMATIREANWKQMPRANTSNCSNFGNMMQTMMSFMKHKVNWVLDGSLWFHMWFSQFEALIDKPKWVVAYYGTRSCGKSFAFDILSKLITQDTRQDASDCSAKVGMDGEYHASGYVLKYDEAPVQNSGKTIDDKRVAFMKEVLSSQEYHYDRTEKQADGTFKDVNFATEHQEKIFYTCNFGALLGLHSSQIDQQIQAYLDRHVFWYVHELVQSPTTQGKTLDQHISENDPENDRERWIVFDAMVSIMLMITNVSEHFLPHSGPANAHFLIFDQVYTSLARCPEITAREQDSRFCMHRVASCMYAVWSRFFTVSGALSVRDIGNEVLDPNDRMKSRISVWAQFEVPQLFDFLDCLPIMHAQSAELWFNVHTLHAISRKGLAPIDDQVGIALAELFKFQPRGRSRVPYQMNRIAPSLSEMSAPFKDVGFLETVDDSRAPTADDLTRQLNQWTQSSYGSTTNSFMGPGHAQLSLQEIEKRTAELTARETKLLLAMGRSAKGETVFKSINELKDFLTPAVLTEQYGIEGVKHIMRKSYECHTRHGGENKDGCFILPYASDSKNKFRTFDGGDGALRYDFSTVVSTAYGKNVDELTFHLQNHYNITRVRGVPSDFVKDILMRNTVDQCFFDKRPKSERVTSVSEFGDIGAEDQAHHGMNPTPIHSSSELTNATMFDHYAMIAQKNSFLPGMGCGFTSEGEPVKRRIIEFEKQPRKDVSTLSAKSPDGKKADESEIPSASEEARSIKIPTEWIRTQLSNETLQALVNVKLDALKRYVEPNFQDPSGEPSAINQSVETVFSDNTPDEIRSVTGKTTLNNSRERQRGLPNGFQNPAIARAASAANLILWNHKISQDAWRKVVMPFSCSFDTCALITLDLQREDPAAANTCGSAYPYLTSPAVTVPTGGNCNDQLKILQGGGLFSKASLEEGEDAGHVSLSPKEQSWYTQSIIEDGQTTAVDPWEHSFDRVLKERNLFGSQLDVVQLLKGVEKGNIGYTESKILRTIGSPPVTQTTVISPVTEVDRLRQMIQKYKQRMKDSQDAGEIERGKARKRARMRAHPPASFFESHCTN